METLKKNIQFAEKAVLLVLGLAATLLMCANAVGRYVFSTTIVWAEEGIRVMFVWGMFIAISHAFITNEHIGFTTVADRTRWTRITSAVITNLVLAITGLALCVLGAQYSLMTGAIRLAGSNLPTAVLQIPGILAGGFWFLLAVYRLVRLALGKGLPEPATATDSQMVID